MTIMRLIQICTNNRFKRLVIERNKSLEHFRFSYLKKKIESIPVFEPYLWIISQTL